MVCRSWQPILEEEPRRRARQAIDRIRDGLPRLPVGYPPKGGIRGDSALDVGRLGQAIFWSYLADVDGDGAARERALDCLDSAIEELARLVAGPSLFAGFLGVGWVSEYLRSRLDAGAEAEDPNTEIDAALLQGLAAGDPRQSGHNLFAGVVGGGVYALECWPESAAREALEKIVEWLAVSAEEQPEGFTWRTPPEALTEAQRQACPRGYFNLGLGHGIPGVVTLLAAICRCGVASSTVRPLLAGALSWLLSKAGDAAGRPTYPRYWFEERPPAALPEVGSLSWCFGDPGVAVALLAGARALDHGQSEAAGRALAAAAARRLLTTPDDHPPDPGLCHGSAGTAHVFHRLYQITGEEECRTASRQAYDRLLGEWHDERGQTGFSTLPMSVHLPTPGETPEQREVGGLTRGVAGIGAALLAASSDTPPDWDRLLLLSTREPPATSDRPEASDGEPGRAG